MTLTLTVGLVSGCMDRGATDCVDGVCQEIADPGDALLANVTRPTASMDGCIGVYGQVSLPAQLVEPHLPAEFEPDALAYGMADARILAMECPRATIENQIVEPYRFLSVGVRADPVNESWNPPSTVSLYVLEHFVNDQETARLLAGWGVPAIPAEIDVTASSAGPAPMIGWIVRSESASYSFEFAITEEGTDGGFGAAFALWNGREDFQRVDTNDSYMYGGNARWPLAVTVEGDAALGRLSGAEVVTLVGTPYRTFESEMQPYPIPFSP